MHPDPAFTSMPDPDPHKDDANLRPLVYRPFILDLHCERPRPRFELLKLLNFDFNVYPDPAFHFNGDPDPDPASKNKEDPDTPSCV